MSSTLDHVRLKRFELGFFCKSNFDPYRTRIPTMRSSNKTVTVLLFSLCYFIYYHLTVVKVFPHKKISERLSYFTNSLKVYSSKLFKISRGKHSLAYQLEKSPLSCSKLGGQGSSLGRTSTHGLKIIEQKGLPLH